jgi:hypothetical protein
MIPPITTLFHAGLPKGHGKTIIIGQIRRPGCFIKAWAEHSAVVERFFRKLPGRRSCLFGNYGFFGGRFKGKGAPDWAPPFDLGGR